MPWYSDLKFFQKSDNGLFNLPDKVGSYVFLSGIYRCSLCGHEIVAVKGETFPPDGLHGEDKLSADHHKDGEPKEFHWELVAAPKHRHAHKDVIA